MDKDALFEKIGKVLSDTGKEISHKTKIVADKTKDMADVSKLTMKINLETAAVNKKYQKMGEALYRKVAEHGIKDEEMEWFCNKIKDNIEVIKDLNREIQGIKGVPICFVCGKEIDKKSFYCRHCGHRTERSARDMKEAREEILKEAENRTEAYKDTEIIEGKMCSICKAYCEYDDLFCSCCGIKLKDKDAYL